MEIDQNLPDAMCVEEMNIQNYQLFWCSSGFKGFDLCQQQLANPGMHG